MPQITVIGAGVAGLTTAHELLVAGHSVAVVAEKFTPDTTSDVSAAMWWPFHADPPDKVLRWCLSSFEQFALLTQNKETGVVMRPGIFGFGPQRPEWADRIPSGVATPLGELPPECESGLSVVAPMVEMNRYMPWLRSEIVRLGATLSHAKVESFDSVFETADIVVNTSGLGARELAHDTDVSAARGRVLRYEQVGIESFIGSEAGEWPMHVFPRRDDVIVGGSYEPGIEELAIPSEMDDLIAQRAIAAQPLLKNAKRIGAATGLRPSRSTVRLESKAIGHKLLVHNYGHGGSGVTISWGCANEAAAMCDEWAD